MPSLAPFTSTQVSVDETLTLAFPDSVIKYTMTLDMPGDTALANNNTNTFTTTTTASTLPPVRSLVSNDQNSVDIVWQAPDLDLLPAGQRLETFENYDFWQGANLGDWTNIDGDQLNVKGFVSNGQTMPSRVSRVISSTTATRSATSTASRVPAPAIAPSPPSTP